MRIAIVIPSFYPATIYGGTIFASLNFSKLMVQSGYEVYVSTTNSNKKERLNVQVNKFFELEKNLFVKYYNETVVDKVSLPLIFSLWRDIKKVDFVHVHAIFNTPIPAALFYSWVFGKPVLLSPHGVLGEWVMKNGSVFKKLWLNFFIRPFSGYVHWHATSIQEEREIRAHFPRAKIHIIANPIDTTLFKNSPVLNRTSFLKKFGNNNSGEPEKIIVSMGRLQKKKGFDILMRSFKILSLEIPGAYLFIAGEDEGEKKMLMKLIVNCGLEEKVFLVGNLKEEEKIPFLANADLFVLPSHNENFGIVYAEALAAGTPVVASKETPWEEVEKYGCGRWANNSVDETAEAMIEMIRRSDPDIRQKAQEFSGRFSFRNVQKELDKVITSILKQDA